MSKKGTKSLLFFISKETDINWLPDCQHGPVIKGSMLQVYKIKSGAAKDYVHPCNSCDYRSTEIARCNANVQKCAMCEKADLSKF